LPPKKEEKIFNKKEYLKELEEERKKYDQEYEQRRAIYDFLDKD
jgi:hypothetical protein